MNGRRSEVEIIAEILKLAENGAKQTAIMYGCNLNHGRVRGYLDTLEMRGLLECRRNDPHTEYFATDKGRYFLHHLDIALVTLENAGAMIDPNTSVRPFSSKPRSTPG